MEITKQFAAVLKAALAIAKSNGKHLPHFQALLIQGDTIAAACLEMSLRIKLAAPLAPQMGDAAFKLDCATVKGALSIDRKALNVLREDTNKLVVNGISVHLDDATRFADEYGILTTRMNPKRASPAYEEAELGPLFWANLERVRPAMAEHDIRQYLMGVLMDFGNRRIVATDGHRLHLANGKTLPAVAPLSKDEEGNSVATPGMVLRREAVDIIQALKPKSVSTWLPVLEATKVEPAQQGLFVFRGEDTGLSWELTTSSIDCLFPDVDRVIPPPYAMRRQIALQNWERRPDATSVPTQVVIPTYTQALEAFVKAFKAAGNSRYEPAVIVDLESGRLRNVRENPVSIDKEVFCVNDDDGWQRPLSQAHTQCGVNARYLAEGLKALGQNVTWDIDPQNVWRATDHGDLTVVIMALRI